MKRKIFKEPMLILGAIVLIAFLSMTGVMAFRYFQTYMDPIKHEDLAQKNILEQKPEATVQDKTTVPISNNSSSIPFEYQEPEKAPDEEIASVRHEDDGEIYTYLPQEVPVRETPFRKHNEVDHQEYGRSPAQEIGRPLLSPTARSRPDSSTITTTGSSIDYIPPNNQSWESGESGESGNVSTARDKDYHDENYSVLVSRDFISGSLYQGEIDVVLFIYVDSIPPNGLIVKEYIPEGWDVLESMPPYKNFNPSTGEIKWLFIGDEVKTTEINYKVIKRETSSVEAFFHGTYLYNNQNGKHITMQIDGADGV